MPSKGKSSKYKRVVKKRPAVRIPSVNRLTKTFPVQNYLAAMPFPSRTHRNLKYSDTSTLTTVAGGLAGTEVVYNLNSLFKPRFSLGGHQPYGFNQMEALYETYMVHAVSVKIDWLHYPGDTQAGVSLIQASQDGYVTNGRSIDTIKEQPNGMVAFSNFPGTARATTDYGTITIAELEGITEQKVRDSQEFQANIGATPIRAPHLRLNVVDVDGNSGFSVIANVTLIYHTWFYDRKTHDRSV